MDPKTRYEQERNDNKLQRELHIIEAAERVFVDKGIEKATMHDIAKEVNIGIATLFRYFPKKEKLIVTIATKQIEKVLAVFQSVSEQPVSCIEKLERLFDFFCVPLVEKDDRYIKFLEDFENYAAHSQVPLEGIEDFNNLYRKVSQVFQSIIQDGVRDGSLRPGLPVRETLTTVVNAFAMFSRKLSLQRNILMLEPDLEPENQLAVLKKILMEYLRA